MRVTACTLALLVVVSAVDAFPAPSRVAVQPRAVAATDTNDRGDVAVAFRLSDRAGRPADVELQYGVDADGDGRVRESEFLPAAERTDDARSTRGAGGAAFFGSAKGRGAANVIVWRSRVDLGDAGYVRPKGRGRSSASRLGVRLRLRTVGDDGRRSGWAYAPFASVDDRRAPDVGIEGAYFGRVTYFGPPTAAGPDEAVIEIDWRAIDQDAEAMRDAPVVSVDFSYRVPTADEMRRRSSDPTFDPAELAWTPCKAARFPFDDPAPARGTASSSSAGAAHVFEWQAKDLGWHSAIHTPEAGPPTRWIFLRAEPVGDGGLRGPTRFLLTPIATR